MTQLEQLVGVEVAAAIRFLAGEEVSSMTAWAIHSIIEAMPYSNIYSYTDGFSDKTVLHAGHSWLPGSDDDPNDTRPIFDCVKGWL